MYKSVFNTFKHLSNLVLNESNMKYNFIIIIY